MSQRALIPESLTNRDVEVRKLSRRPPLSFVPSEKGESGKDKTTVKVKINDDLVESVEPFDGTSPEQYMNLIIAKPKLSDFRINQPSQHVR